MRKDVVVVRESIGRIVSMLTGRRVKVTQRGTQAFVAYKQSGEIESVNIPYIPDDATDEFIAAVQGFLDHEVGHVLFSHPKGAINAAKHGMRVKNIANIIEDVFVERKMSEAFRGAGHNINVLSRYYQERISRPKIDAAIAAGDVETANGYAIVIAMRAWGGQSLAADFIKDPKIAALVAPIAVKLGDAIHEIAKCNSSADCLALAVKFKKLLEAPKPAPPPPPPPPAPTPPPPAPPEPESSDSDDDEPSQGAEDVDSGKGDPADSPGAGGAEEENSEGEGEPEEPSAPEAAPPEDDEAEEGDSDVDVPDTSKVDFDAPEPEPEAGEEEGEGEGDAPADDGGEDPGGEDAAGEGQGASTDEGEAPDADAGEVPTPGEGEGEEPSPAGDEPGGQGGSSEPEPDPLAEMFDEERDFDKDMAEELSKRGRKEIESAEYKIFSTDWDVIEPARFADYKESAPKMVQEAQAQIGVMQKQLERALAAKAKKAWDPGRRKGRINPGALYRTAIGNDRVFRQRIETRAKDTVVTILIDNSASMVRADKIGTAGRVGYALSATLTRLKIKHEILGFTTRPNSEMMSAMRVEGDFFYEYGRAEGISILVYKDFNEQLSSSVISRLAHLTEGEHVWRASGGTKGCGMWLESNVDGESVQLAARRLVVQPAERHILMVLSDGNPASMPGTGLKEHLKKVVAELPARGVEVIGIGILDDAVKDYYPKCVVVRDIGELPTTVMAEITNLLLN